MMKNFKTIHGGWQAKMGPGVLSDILTNIKVIEDENTILNFSSNDDASVYKLDDKYLFQTLDFFTPNVDDPYTFGQIVAANSLSDIYAMGAEPVTCQSIVGYPKKEEFDSLNAMMQGCCDKLIEANVSLTGGHSIYDKNVKFGLSVLGIGNVIWKNNGVCADDVLILTKKLGSGIINSATNKVEVDQDAFDECIQTMTTLNKYAKDVMKNYQINSCTDITGFGLLGHLYEMINKTSYGAKIYAKNIQLISKTLHYAKIIGESASTIENKNHVDKHVTFNDISEELINAMYDAQTSGGLLFSVSKQDAKQLIEELHSNNIEANIIGEIVQNTNNTIEVYNEHI